VKKLLLLLIATLLFVSGRVAEFSAVDLRDVLTDYTFTSWSRKDGLAGPVWAIAQDADGFLWIGTDEGLLRFDGVRFASWETLGGTPLPHLPVRALHIASNASLWVGFGGTGGIARIQGKAVHVYGLDEGGRTGAIAAIAEDPSHVMWAAASEGLFRLSGDLWHRRGTPEGLPDGAAVSITVDAAGTLWAGTVAGLYSRTSESPEHFQQVEPSGDSTRFLSLTAGPDGKMWTSDPVIGFRAIGASLATDPDERSGRGYRMLHDRDGNLWVGTIGQGLWRVRHGDTGGRPRVERATVLSGLSSDAVRSVFEDRDGNIWTGTTEGIDRLVQHRITPWTSIGLVGTIDAGKDAHIWVGTEDEIIRFSATHGAWGPDNVRLPLRSPRAIRADGSGTIWVSTNDDLFRIDGNRAALVPFPPGIPASWTEAITADRRAGVWVAAIGGQILHDAGGRLQVFDHVDALKDARIMAAASDRHDHLWLAYTGSQVGVLSGKGQFRSYGTAQGLVPGPYYAIYEDTAGDIWVCGASGLSRFNGDGFSSVGRSNGVPLGGVYAMTEDEQQYLWLATSAGIIRLAKSEFDLAAANPNDPMHFRLYDTSDGLAGFPALLGDRNAIRAEDGTLWFVTSRGLSIVNPKTLAATRPTPRVMIDEIRADDRLITSTSLPAGTAKLEIGYTAPDLTYPLKTRFRYRLEGFDTDWVNAGARRQVLYTNLPPRSYAFHVSVSGEEGRWSESPATVIFSIAPRFYQTLWFYPLCALVVTGIIAGAWQLRLRQLRRQFSLVLGERVRLSRELHDTLLQSLVGVALEFDAVSKSLETSPASAKERVVKIREHVEEYIREARRSIWSLRSPALETGDLIEALRESAERATASQSIDFSFTFSGTPRRLGAPIEHQLLRISQEAVLNAVRHAEPRHIRMLLDYGDNDTLVILRISDDGTGFDPRRTAEGTTDHYGIITMRERAQQAGGQVTINSEPGHGTVVEAQIPTAHAAPEET
jgi:signal transduction histidine kinase/ligand-binding sensor domain-containing protein